MLNHVLPNKDLTLYRDPVVRTLIALYGLVLPVTSAFAFTQIINLPLIVSLVLLSWMIFRQSFRLPRAAMYVVALFVVPILISAVVNIEFTGDEKFVNHLASYFAVVILFYLVPSAFMHYQGGVELFIRWINVGLAISCLFLIFEFIAINFISSDVLDLIPRPAVQGYEPIVLDLLIRPRSFVEESGHFAMYIGILGPTCLLLKKRGLRIALGMLYAFAMMLTFSTSGYIALALIIGIALLLRTRLVLPSIIVLTLFCLLAIPTEWLDSISAVMSSTFIEKFSSGSFEERYAFLYESLRLWERSGVTTLLFGLGPGYYSYWHVNAVISLYALILFQSGIIGAILFAVLLGMYVLKCLRRIPQLEAVVFVMALSSMFVFYAGVSNYWYPWVWGLFALIDREVKRQPILRTLST